MNNIIRIFLSDVKRLSTNVVAVVVIIGLSVIPCLYAWFNIFSNWAPYNASATGHLAVAVVSMDHGVELGGVKVNAGDIICKNLKENKTIGWKFPGSDVDAVEGVKNGTYYAAFVIDRDFSKNMVSFIGGDAKHPEIIYYENDKKNAIAPKITGKVKTAITQEVNRSFVSTLTKGFLTVTSDLEGAANKAGAGNVIDHRLNTMDSDLSTCVSIIDTYISFVDTTSKVMKAAKEISDEADRIKDSMSSVSKSAGSAVQSAGKTVDTAGDMITINMNRMGTELDSLERTMDDYFKDVDKAVAVTNAELESLKAAAESTKAAFQTIRRQIAASGITETAMVKKNADAVEKDFTVLDQDMSALQKANTKTSKDANQSYKAVKADIRVCRKDIQRLSDTYQNTVAPQLARSMDSVKKSVDDVRDMLGYSDSSISELAGMLSSYPDMMSLGKEQLKKSRRKVVRMQEELHRVMDKNAGIEKSEQYRMLMRLLSTSPEEVAQFITSPIDLQIHPVFPVKNNGSAMAPFYIVLSIWVGSLILVAIIHTKVRPIPGVENMKSYQEYFGRYIVFFLIGQIQTLITVLGALLYVRIQCIHPFMLWFAMSLTSLTYTLLLYSLAYALDAVGEAIAVVLMVIQVAGSGGTFPIEVLPVEYQKLYEYMPFAYSINAAREAVAGTYKRDYVTCLSGLLVVLAVSLVIGLFISIPCRKMNVIIKKSTEKTDLIL
ncbi:putative membrane protein [Lachnospiraceae bacterium C10]|nr:putative membrane protein [Lachnospiraceae bacterium C10]